MKYKKILVWLNIIFATINILLIVVQLLHRELFPAIVIKKEELLLALALIFVVLLLVFVTMPVIILSVVCYKKTNSKELMIVTILNFISKLCVFFLYIYIILFITGPSV